MLGRRSWHLIRHPGSNGSAPMMASRFSSACSFSSDQPSVPAGRSGILMKLRARAHAR